MLSKKDIKHLAKLARLSLSDKEIKTYTSQLQEVLKYIDQLGEVDTANTEPTYQVLDGTVNVLREDEIKPSLSQVDATSQSPSNHNGYFVVENVFTNVRRSVVTTKPKKRKKIDKHNSVLTKVNPKGNIAHKDLFMTKGVETTAGSNMLDGYRAHYSSSVVNLFERKGFKTKYKLNQDAWGHGASGENSDYGPTNNPWDKTKVAGGSSSGTGVVVATGDVDLATGTDTCGSIRMPASFCGVCGLKPTYGALSRYGVIAFASSLDCPSLMSTSVRKLRKAFEAVSARDPSDATSQSDGRKTTRKKALTIGLPKEFFGRGVDEGVKNKILEAVEVFKGLGLKTQKVSLPHSKFGVSAYYIIAPTETSSNLARYDGVRYGHGRENFGSEAKRRIMLGTYVSSKGYSEKYYQKAALVRTKIIQDFEEVFQNVDVLMGPVAPTPAFGIGEKVDDPLSMYLMDIFAAPASLSGIPSLALPCGFSSKHLPIGFQLMGPRWSEPMLFDLGEKYQSKTKWHEKKPILR
ncbi:Asp-tRNA(Asn)/Glu-tRNA(Gln) amidotransferase subunit GatC [Patescibacteria group bacterium]